MDVTTFVIDPSLQYVVSVNKVHAASGVKFRPRHEYTVKGTVAALLQSEGVLASIALA